MCLDPRQNVPLNMFYSPFEGGATFVDPFCYLCFTFIFIIQNGLSFLFLAALWQPAGKRMTSWYSYV